MQVAHGLLIVSQRLEKLLGAELVDQGHGAFGDAMVEQETVIDRGDDIDNGIAQAGDVILCHAAPRNLLKIRSFAYTRLAARRKPSPPRREAPGGGDVRSIATAYGRACAAK